VSKSVAGTGVNRQTTQLVDWSADHFAQPVGWTVSWSAGRLLQLQ